MKSMSFEGKAILCECIVLVILVFGVASCGCTEVQPQYESVDLAIVSIYPPVGDSSSWTAFSSGGSTYLLGESPAEGEFLAKGITLNERQHFHRRHNMIRGCSGFPDCGKPKTETGEVPRIKVDSSTVTSHKIFWTSLLRALPSVAFSVVSILFLVLGYRMGGSCGKKWGSR